MSEFNRSCRIGVPAKFWGVLFTSGATLEERIGTSSVAESLLFRCKSLVQADLEWSEPKLYYLRRPRFIIPLRVFRRTVIDIPASKGYLWISKHYI